MIGNDNGDLKPGTYTEHLMSLQELAQKFKTLIEPKDVMKSSGLKPSECAQRLLEFGPNRLTPPKNMTLFERIIRIVFLDAFMVMLLGASILTFITWILSPGDYTNLYLAIVLLAIILLTTMLTLFQEGKASDVMSGFENLLPTTSFVIRNGSKTKVLSSELVKGDIVILDTGDKVPADIRILASNSLKVDNSSLTGEYLPVSLTVDPDSEEALEARNIAFSGTLVVEGTGVGICIRTGDHSYVGSIAALASQTGSEKSTLTKEIELFVRFVGIMAFCSGLALFTVSLIRSGTSLNSIVDGIISTFIVVIVANVPQGLPSAVAGCLTVAAVNLANRNVYVKSLNSIETLGSVSVIASDKTGTLTKNQMTVTSIWLNEQSRQVSRLHKPEDRDYRHKEGEFPNENPLSDALSAMLFVSATCNQASLMVQTDTVVIDEEVLMTSNEEGSLGIGNRRPTATSMLFSGRDPPGATLSVAALAADPNARPEPVKTKNLSGNASDIALYVFADTHGVKPVQAVREEWRQVFTVPFSSARKWMATVMAPPATHADQSRVLCVKGAPERILAKCTKILVNGQIVPLSQATLQSFEQCNSRYMKQGRRVLGMAFRILPLSDHPSKLESTMEQVRFQGIFDSGKLVPEPEQMNDANALVLVGCTALEDPPKDSVPEAVLRCREAGIKVVMVTGDHPATAAAIAKQCNIMGLYKTKDDLPQSESNKEQNAAKDGDNDSEIGGVVVTGKELAQFSDADWNRVLSKPEIVFARTSPHDKLEIVSRLQKRGEVVAVTGDGVNDSPALKRADVGVAMGISGSEVAKDAGDIILIDDEFISLVAGIEQGRIIFDNLTKLVAYTLTHLLPELVAVLLGLGLGAPVGMTSLMILSIDLLTEMGPSISLAYEGAEDIVMFRPPRDINKDKLVSKRLLGYAYVIAGVLETIPCLIAYFGVFMQYHVRLSDLINTPYFAEGSASYRNTIGEVFDAKMQLQIAANAQTAYYCTLVLGQFFHIWMCKTRVVSIFEHGLFGNVVMDLGVLVALGSMLTITYVPAFQTIFGTAIHDQFWFFVPSLISFVALWLWNELRKLCFRRYPNSQFTKVFGW